MFEIDLDAQLPLGASIEEQFMWHESRALHHTTEMLRLRPAAGGDAPTPLTTSDMARLREVVSEWNLEEGRLRRGGGATPAARQAYFYLRDLLEAGKLG